MSKKDNVIVQQAKRIVLLEKYVALSKLKKFGASTEKSPDQREMFNEVELTVATEAMLATQKDIQPSPPMPLKRHSFPKPSHNPCPLILWPRQKMSLNWVAGPMPGGNLSTRKNHRRQNKKQPENYE